MKAVALIAVLIAVAAATYCGNSPVSYTLTEAYEVAGFVWTGDTLDISCVEVATERRSDLMTLKGAVWCHHSEKDVENGQSMVTKLADIPNYLSAKSAAVKVTCDHVNATISVGFYSSQASATNNVKIWYNVNAATTGKYLGQYNGKN